MYFLLAVNIINSSLSADTNLGIEILWGHTGIIVRIVLFILIALSVWCWAVIIAKFLRFRKVQRETIAFLVRFHQQKNLTAFYRESAVFKETPLVYVFKAGYGELVRILKMKETDKGKHMAFRPGEGELIRDTLYRTMYTAMMVEKGRLEKWLTILASTGSSAPFIGLFGTVWGIMNSFRNIGLQGSANLAVVAPGISEALIATAVGLVAAIPAVIFYNYFMQRIRTVEIETKHFIGDFMNVVDRDMIRRITATSSPNEVSGVVSLEEPGQAVL